MMPSTAIIKEQELKLKPTKWRISAETYQEMGKAGIFQGKPRVELINGEIFTMSPITSDHNSHVDKISTYFNVCLFKKANIRTQGAIRIDDFSEPEPDIAILRFDEKYYTKAHPSPKDVHLIIEVAVFSLKHDRSIKKKNYAESNIPEYWIVIPMKKKIEVYRQSKEGDYTEKVVYKKEDTWTIQVFNLEVRGSDFLI